MSRNFRRRQLAGFGCFVVGFSTLKMQPLTLALIKTGNHHLFDPLIKNCPFSMENSLAIGNSKISCKICIF